jgi:hypothetical protein
MDVNPLVPAESTPRGLWFRSARPGWTWTLRAELSVAVVQQLTDATWDELVSRPGVTWLKRGPLRSVIRLATEAGPVIIKRFVDHSWRDRWKRMVRGSAAAWEAERSCLASARGLPTAKVWGYGFSSATGGAESWLILDCLERTTSLAAYRPDPQVPDPPQPHDDSTRAALLEVTASLIARLHGGGMWHRDLHAGNILLRDDPEGWRAWLIDAAALRAGRRTGPRQVVDDLARFWLSTERMWSRCERREFAQSYWRALRTYDRGLALELGSSPDEAASFLQRETARTVAPIHAAADRAWSRGTRKILSTSDGRWLTALGPASIASAMAPWLARWSQGIDEEQWEGIVSRRLLLADEGGPRTWRLSRFPRPRARGVETVREIWERGHQAHRRNLAVAIPWGYWEGPDATWLLGCEPRGSAPYRPTAPRDRHVTAGSTASDAIAEWSRHLPASPPPWSEVLRSSSDGRWVGWCALERLPMLRVTPSASPTQTFDLSPSTVTRTRRAA